MYVDIYVQVHYFVIFYESHSPPYFESVRLPLTYLSYYDFMKFFFHLLKFNGQGNDLGVGRIFGRTKAVTEVF